jgi:hypothetical protein
MGHLKYACKDRRDIENFPLPPEEVVSILGYPLIPKEIHEQLQGYTMFINILRAVFTNSDPKSTKRLMA